MDSYGRGISADEPAGIEDLTASNKVTKTYRNLLDKGVGNAYIEGR